MFGCNDHAQMILYKLTWLTMYNGGRDERCVMIKKDSFVMTSCLFVISLVQAQLLEQRAMTHGDGKDAKAAAEKLKR